MRKLLLLLSVILCVPIFAQSGTIVAAPQYSTVYYSASGSSTTLSGESISGIPVYSTSAPPRGATSTDLQSVVGPSVYNPCGTQTAGIWYASCAPGMTHYPNFGDCSNQLECAWAEAYEGVLALGTFQKVIAAPGVVYTNTHVLAYPTYPGPTNYSPTILLDGNGSTVQAASGFPAGHALLERVPVASQAPEAVQIENINLIPWPYAGSAISIANPGGDGSRNSCFLRNIHYYNGTDTGFGSAGIYMGSRPTETPNLPGYECTATELHGGSAQPFTTQPPSHAKLLVSVSGGVPTITFAQSCSASGVGTGSSYCYGAGYGSAKTRIRLVSGAGPASGGVEPWVGCSVIGEIYGNIVNGQMTSLTVAVPYSGCQSTMYALAVDGGPTQHSLWWNISDGYVDKTWTSQGTNPSYTGFTATSCVVTAGSASITYTGLIGDTVAVNQSFLLSGFTTCTQLNGLYAAVVTSTPATSTTGSFTITNAALVGGQTGSAESTYLYNAYPGTAVEQNGSDFGQVHAYDSDIGMNVTSQVDDLYSDSEYTLGAIIQPGGRVLSGNMFWDQKDTSTGAQGFYFYGNGVVSNMACGSSQTLGGFYLLTAKGVVLDNNLANYPFTISNQGDWNCGLATPTLLQDHVPSSAGTQWVNGAALSGQTTDIGQVALQTNAPAGHYRLSCQLMTTQAATTSATAPRCQMIGTDPITSTTTSATIFGTNSSLNAIGSSESGSFYMDIKAGTTIYYNISGTASSGATPYAYKVVTDLERVH